MSKTVYKVEHHTHYSHTFFSRVIFLIINPSSTMYISQVCSNILCVRLGIADPRFLGSESRKFRQERANDTVCLKMSRCLPIFFKTFFRALEALRHYSIA